MDEFTNMQWLVFPPSAHVDATRLRSWLCSSSLRVDLCAKAEQADADVAHFDLEDSVPGDQKEAARRALAEQLEPRAGRPTAVRINGLTTLDGLRDVVFLAQQPVIPDIVILPKVSMPRDVAIVEATLKPAHPGTLIFGIVETAQSLWELRGMSAVPGGLSGIILGAADLATDLGVDVRDADLAFARYEIALFARRFGLVAIDSPCFQMHDEAALRAQLREARTMGFAGKIAIHPSQVALINETFTPSKEALDRAARLLDLHDGSRNRSIHTLGEMMVGPPFVRHAREIIEKSPETRRRARARG